jgi:arginyl-tRNA synthetase
MSFAATKVFLDKNEKTTDILGISAVIINDLKQRRQRDYEFDWNRALQVKSSSVVTVMNMQTYLLKFLPFNPSEAMSHGVKSVIFC